MEVSDICGPLMQDEINKLIINTKHYYDHAYDECTTKECERVDACINLLIDSSNDELYSTYVNMPVDYEDYQNNYDELDNIIEDKLDNIIEDKLDNIIEDKFDNIIEDKLDNDAEDVIYSHYEYTYAILSDISLINRCLLISKAILNNAINALAHHHHYIGEIPRKFGINSCKLLHLHEFNLFSLLKLAQCKHDYESITYIINAMTEIDLYNVVYNNYLTNDITNILLIDKCKQISNKYILSLLDKCIQNIIHSPVITCYYIINMLDPIKTHIKNIRKYIRKNIRKNITKNV
jgi:hypothetical protein